MRRPRVEPVSWRPPPLPEFGGAEPVASAERVGVGVLRGPEDVAADPATGELCTGCEDGWVYRVSPDGARVWRWAEVGGRPLGLAFDAGGGLVVCNHPLGLQRVDREGRVELLAGSAGGSPIRFANGCVVAADGGVWFTESSTKFHLASGCPPPHGGYDMLEARPHGRLLRYDPSAREARVVCDGLYFPNGVALAAGGGGVLVVETFRYRVVRVDAATGARSVLIDNLPGFPDNVKAGAGGGVWYVALGAKRGALADGVQRWPRVKGLIARLPPGWWQRPRAAGVVLEVDRHGSVCRAWRDARREWGLIASATPAGGALWLGTLGDGLVRLAVEGGEG